MANSRVLWQLYSEEVEAQQGKNGSGKRSSGSREQVQSVGPTIREERTPPAVVLKQAPAPSSQQRSRSIEPVRGAPLIQRPPRSKAQEVQSPPTNPRLILALQAITDGSNAAGKKKDDRNKWRYGWEGDDTTSDDTEEMAEPVEPADIIFDDEKLVTPADNATSAVIRTAVHFAPAPTSGAATAALPLTSLLSPALTTTSPMASGSKTGQHDVTKSILKGDRVVVVEGNHSDESVLCVSLRKALEDSQAEVLTLNISLSRAIQTSHDLQIALDASERLKAEFQAQNAAFQAQLLQPHMSDTKAQPHPLHDYTVEIAKVKAELEGAILARDALLSQVTVLSEEVDDAETHVQAEKNVSAALRKLVAELQEQVLHPYQTSIPEEERRGEEEGAVIPATTTTAKSPSTSPLRPTSYSMQGSTATTPTTQEGARLLAENAGYKMQQTNLQDAIANHVVTIKQLQADKQTYESALQSLQASHIKVSGALSTATSNVTQLRETLQTTTNALEASQQQYNAALQHSHELQVQLRAQEADVRPSILLAKVQPFAHITLNHACGLCQALQSQVDELTSQLFDAGHVAAAEHTKERERHEAALLQVSEDARIQAATYETQLQEARNQNEAIVTDLSTTRARLSDSEALSASLQTQLEQACRRTLEVQQSCEESMAALRYELHQAIQRVASSTEKKTELEGIVTTLTSQLTRIQGRMHTLIADKATLITSLTAMHTHMVSLQQEVQYMKEDSQSELNERQEDMARVCIALNASTQGLLEAYSFALSQRDAAREEVIVMEGKLTAAESQITETEAGCEDLQCTIASLQSQLHVAGQQLEAATERQISFNYQLEEGRLAAEALHQDLQQRYTTQLENAVHMAAELSRVQLQLQREQGRVLQLEKMLTSPRDALMNGVELFSKPSITVQDVCVNHEAYTPQLEVVTLDSPPLDAFTTHSTTPDTFIHVQQRCALLSGQLDDALWRNSELASQLEVSEAEKTRLHDNIQQLQEKIAGFQSTQAHENELVAREQSTTVDCIDRAAAERTPDKTAHPHRPDELRGMIERLEAANKQVAQHVEAREELEALLRDMQQAAQELEEQALDEHNRFTQLQTWVDTLAQQLPSLSSESSGDASSLLKVSDDWSAHQVTINQWAVDMMHKLAEARYTHTNMLRTHESALVQAHAMLDALNARVNEVGNDLAAGKAQLKEKEHHIVQLQQSLTACEDEAARGYRLSSHRIVQLEDERCLLKKEMEGLQIQIQSLQQDLENKSGMLGDSIAVIDSLTDRMLDLQREYDASMEKSGKEITGLLTAQEAGKTAAAGLSATIVQLQRDLETAALNQSSAQTSKGGEGRGEDGIRTPPHHPRAPVDVPLTNILSAMDEKPASSRGIAVPCEACEEYKEMMQEYRVRYHKHSIHIIPYSVVDDMLRRQWKRLWYPVYDI
jgi:chromosome segregation ATPase